MTKNEYLNNLMIELKKKHVADAEDIVSEYKQHFAFKLADGYTEEEISARLGDPVALASQFEIGNNSNNNGGRKIITVIGLCFADIFVGAFYVLLFAWEVITAAFSLACATVAVCLFGDINIHSLIPPMPYGCGLVFGIAFVALAVMSAVGCIYFYAFVRQLIRSYARFHHNAIAAAAGSAALPYLTINPQLPAKTNRRIRTVALLSLSVFAALFVFSMIISMLSSGSLEFWHTWGWFVK